MIDPEPKWKATLRPFVPIYLRRVRRVLFGWRWFRGRFATWNEAKASATGYDQPAILSKVLRATLEVKAGRGAFERDSVVFPRPASDPQLVSLLLKVAAENGGRLRVLDFGGSLGSTYWQHRGDLAGLCELKWDVVEQAHYAEVGREHFQDDVLGFFSSLDDAQRGTAHDLFLASTVIQYLPEPHEFLEDVISRGFPYLLFHNVPLHEPAKDYLRVQHVPPEIYPASYPAWFFNRSRFLAHFRHRYTVEFAYDSPATWWVGLRDYPSTGLFLKKTANAPASE